MSEEEPATALRADLLSVGELLAAVSVYGLVCVVGALWLGVAVRIALAAARLR